MNHLKKIKRHHIFWTVAILFLVGSFLTNYDSALDINVHDTYFVIAHFQLYMLFCFIMGFLGLGYWIISLLKRKLYRTLTIIHVFLTLAGIMAFIFPGIFTVFESNNKNLPYPNFDDLSSVNEVIAIGLLIILSAQLFYVINLVSSFLRKREL